MVDCVLKKCKKKPMEAVIVGDRLYTDIACGLNAGVETALVYTGEARPEDLKETAYPPDYVYENVEELLEAFQAARGEE